MFVDDFYQAGESEWYVGHGVVVVAVGGVVGLVDGI